MNNPFCEPKTPLGPRYRVADIGSASQQSRWLFVGGDDDCGRKTMIDTIRDLLQEQTPRPIQLVGCYGIGKTATVEYAVLKVNKEREKKDRNNRPYGIVIVSGDNIEESPAIDNKNRFLANLFRAVGWSVNSSDVSSQREEGSSWLTLEGLLDILKNEVSQRYERLIVVLDSFEIDSPNNDTLYTEIRDFVEEIIRLGWLLVIETRYSEDFHYRIRHYAYVPPVARVRNRTHWPEVVDSNANGSNNQSQELIKIDKIQLRGLSRRHARQLIWGASREPSESFRTPYYLSQWRRWRQFWIPFLVQRYTGTHPLLLHTACYEIDFRLREHKLDKVEIVEAINDSLKFRYRMLNKLQKNIVLSVQDLSSGNSDVRRKAQRNLEKQGLLIKSWHGRSHLPEMLGSSSNRPAPTPPDPLTRPHISVSRQEIEKQYLSSTFAIWDQGRSNKIGTGFLINHNDTIYGITCAHNIHAVFQDGAEEGLEFYVELASDNSNLKVKIIYYKPGRSADSKQWAATEDIAILSVESDVSTGAFFPLTSPSTEHKKQGLNTFFGYFVPAGDWVNVSISSSFQYVYSGMYKIYLENFRGSTIERASGAPLLNIQSKEYLGIVRAQQATETDLWAYLIPSTKIHGVLQEIYSNE